MNTKLVLMLLAFALWTQAGCGSNSAHSGSDSDDRPGDEDSVQETDPDGDDEEMGSEEDEDAEEAGDDDGSQPGGPDEADAHLFVPGVMHVIRLTLTPEEVARIDQPERPKVHAAMQFDEQSLPDIGLKLKGGASYRPISARPALTLDINAWVKGARLFGLKAFKLHNGLSYDPTRTHEYLCYKLARAAGLMAPRVSWAEVWVNGVYKGVYTLVEKHDDVMIARHDPALAERGVVLEPTSAFQDFGGDAPLTEAAVLEAWDEGPLPPDPSVMDAILGLDELLRAEPSPTATETLWRIADETAWRTYAAWEGFIANKDSYIVNRNNWRIFVNGNTTTLSWIPSGSDLSWSGLPDVFGDREMLGTEGKMSRFCVQIASCKEGIARSALKLADLAETLDLAEEVKTLDAWLAPYFEHEEGQWFTPQQVEESVLQTEQALSEYPNLVRQQVYEVFPELEP